MLSTSLRVRGVDHVEPGLLPAPDGPQHAPTVLCHRDIVGTPAEPHLVSDLPLARSTGISSACLDLIAGVDLAAISSLSHVSDQLRAIGARRETCRVFPINCNVYASDPHDCFTSTPAVPFAEMAVIPARSYHRRQRLYLSSPLSFGGGATGPLDCDRKPCL